MSQDSPITPEEVRTYLWEAITLTLDHDGLIPCAPSADGQDGLVIGFQRVLPRTFGEQYRFRIRIDPVEIWRPKA